MNWITRILDGFGEMLTAGWTTLLSWGAAAVHVAVRSVETIWEITRSTAMIPIILAAACIRFAVSMVGSLIDVLQILYDQTNNASATNVDALQWYVAIQNEMSFFESIIPIQHTIDSILTLFTIALAAVSYRFVKHFIPTVSG